MLKAKVKFFFLCIVFLLMTSVSNASVTLINEDFSSIDNWTLNQDASWNGVNLILTPGASNKKGSAWYNESFNLTKYKSFTAIFNIGLGYVDNYGGDGITFAVIDTSNGLNALGKGGGGLGYENINNSFAVEFDTYKNTNKNDPGDSSTDHIGINQNGNMESLATAIVGNLEGIAKFFDVQVDFDVLTGEITVYLDGEQKLQTTISNFPTNVYFGFTGATGYFYNLQTVNNFVLTANPVPIPASIWLLVSIVLLVFIKNSSNEKVKVS